MSQQLSPATPRSVSPTSKHKSESAAAFAKFSRFTHKWLSVFLGLALLVIALTGLFLSFKKDLEYLQPATRKGDKGDITHFLPAHRIAEAVLALNLPEAQSLDDINRIELRPSKRMWKVRLEATSNFSSPREIQVDAVSGKVLNVGLRGDQLWMDVHSFMVFGKGASYTTMILSGLVLFWLILTGYYLFFYPYWMKARKARRAGVRPEASDATPAQTPAAQEA
ncbi:MAG: PepSY domain-containing protein [Rhodoferax sp.]